MSKLSLALMLAPVALFLYAYAVYPALLRLAQPFARRRPRVIDPEWPTVTVTVPVYNEERSIRMKLDDLLQLDYPRELLQILVISDASSDATDAIVAEYAAHGVELLRLPARRGKTAAENAAASPARGKIIVNTDATVRLDPRALKMLVQAFSDPTVGVASGRDVSIGAGEREGTRGESQYVGYEMWLRALETRLGSIVGASGCFYGIRAEIYDASFPEQLSRDFASALMARAHGLRAVSVNEAICFVPRAGSLGNEFRRKIRTMARGLETLWRWRRMLNPFGYGTFAFMLLSHKLCRWLVYLSLPFAFLGLVLAAMESRIGQLISAAVVVGLLAGVVAWQRTQRAAPVNRLVALIGFGFASVCAGIVAWFKVLRRQHNAVWEPTRRPA
jgi:cellulose synthase/poly-beta-1,6-N-acetylglucosamine synthase-like glycosyltransferase